MIAITSFAGEIPRTSPRLLEANIGTKAINCNLDRGHLAPLRGPKQVAATAMQALTIFRHDQDGWLYWDSQVNVVESAVRDAINEKPHGHLLITGDRPYPVQYLAGGFECRLGLPRPAAGPLACLVAGAVGRTVVCHAFGSNDPAKNPPRYGDLPASFVCQINAGGAKVAAFAETEKGAAFGESGISRSSSYCYTYIRSLAAGAIIQESAPSPPTAIMDVPEGDGVRLTGFVIPDLPEVNITGIRIYRTVGGVEAPGFHFLCEISLPVSEYLDTRQDRDVSAEILKTGTWDPIPDDACGLILGPYGVYAAFRGNELLLSEPYCPYAFPADYRLTVADRIVALGVVDNSILILTEGRPYLASGAEPGQMQLVRLALEQGCVAAWSMAPFNGGEIYATPDGLQLISPGDQSLLTAQTFTRDQWQDLCPQKIIGALLDGKYFGFFLGTNRGFIFTPGRQDVVFIELGKDAHITAVYHRSVDDVLYLAIGENGGHGIYQWEAGEALPYIWRSRPFFTSRLCSLRAVRIEGDQTGRERIEVRIYGPDLKRARQKLRLENTRTKRVLPTRAEKIWSLELRGKVVVYEARLAGSVESLEYGM